MKFNQICNCSVMVIALILVTPQVTFAYIGPGAGIAAIGTVLALIGGIILAIVACVWYPIKRLIAKIKKMRMSGKEGRSS
jgi:uncharacterized YccA/Bax inhibitor family protein